MAGLAWRKFWYFGVWHEIVAMSRFVGMRDRLRCPACKSVGTYKPHGAWLDHPSSRFMRRWMCKFCGFYQNAEEGVMKVFPSKQSGCWQLTRHSDPYCPTPKEILDEVKVNPWFI